DRDRRNYRAELFGGPPLSFEQRRLRHAADRRIPVVDHDAAQRRIIEPIDADAVAMTPGAVLVAGAVFDPDRLPALRRASKRFPDPGHIVTMDQVERA